MASQGPLSAGTGANATGIGTQAWSAANTGIPTQGDVTTANVGVFTATPTSNYLKATNFGFSIPTGATIDGIVAEYNRNAATVSNIIDAANRLVKAGTIQTTDKSSGTNWATSAAYFSYGGASDLWSDTWNVSDVNNSTFGCALAVSKTATGGSGTAHVDHVRMTVYYTVSLAPVANFTGTPTAGTASVSVTFTDSSTNTPTSWLWEKNDGSGWVNLSSGPTAQNPSETFSVGTWSVRLTATNASGSDTLTRTNYITVSAATTAGWLAGYSRRKVITLPAPDASLTDFPVAVSLTADADVGGAARSDGYDIRFADADGITVLSHQRAAWSVSSGQATAVFRVKVPSITAAKSIYIYYGNSANSSDTSTTGVWDSNFVRAFALNETRGTASGNYKDSTSNASNLTLTDADADTVTATGKVGNAIDFSGDSGDLLSGSFSGLASTCTASFWVKVDSMTHSTLNYPFSLGNGSTQRASIWCGGTYGGDGTIGANSIGWFDGTNVSSTADNTFTTASDQGVWRHVAVCYDNGASPKTRIYKDGVLQSMKSSGFTGSIATQTTIQLGLRVDGIFPLNGAVDEVRVSNTARAAAWVKYEFQTETSALSLSAQEWVPGRPPRRRSPLRTLRRM